VLFSFGSAPFGSAADRAHRWGAAGAFRGLTGGIHGGDCTGSPMGSVCFGLWGRVIRAVGRCVSYLCYRTCIHTLTTAQPDQRTSHCNERLRWAAAVSRSGNATPGSASALIVVCACGLVSSGPVGPPDPPPPAPRFPPSRPRRPPRLGPRPIPSYPLANSHPRLSPPRPSGPAPSRRTLDRNIGGC
jgi:hypothetical protein